MTPSAAACRGPSPLGDQAAIVQSSAPRVRPERRERSSPPISPKPRNAEPHVREYRSRAVAGQAGGSAGRAADRVVPPDAVAPPSETPLVGRRSVSIAAGSTRGVLRVGPPGPAGSTRAPRRGGGPGRAVGFGAGGRCAAPSRAAPRAGMRRSADSAAPRRTATRAARRCRSGDRTTSRRAWASGVRIRPSAGRRARPRPSRAGTRSPRGSRRGSARRPTGRNGRGRTG